MDPSTQRYLLYTLVGLTIAILVAILAIYGLDVDW